MARQLPPSKQQSDTFWERQYELQQINEEPEQSVRFQQLPPQYHQKIQIGTLLPQYE